jgi:IclR family acetate operon transcriptional repressor
MIVRQAAHVLELIEFFARHGRPATLSEVAQALGWPRSSTFNLLNTLAELGYLYEPRPREGFYPSPRLLALARSIAEQDPLPAPVAAMLQDLVAELGETAAIVGAVGPHAVFLTVCESPEPVRYHAQSGHKVPLHLTASGRAVLAQYSPAEQAAVLRRARFAPHSPRTPTSVADVEAELRRSAERGWYQNLSEYSRDLCGVAIPFPLAGRRLALVIGGPLSRMQDRVPAIAGHLHAAVARLPKELGLPPQGPG